MSLSSRQPVIIALIVASAYFMENLDATVIATALPHMAATFGVTSVSLSIGMTAYLLALAVFIPISGWVADRFGQRSVFGGAIIVFTGASILCGLSNGLVEFTLARILQGIGGAMMVLLAGGLCRSMQFTSINTLAFADVPPPRMSSASTFFSMVQQMTIGLGIAFGAIALHVAVLIHGNHAQLSLADFRIAFLLVSALVLFSVLYFIGIEPDAGREVSGHTRTAPR